MAEYQPFYTPPSIAGILQNAAATQVPLISQPKGFSNVAGTLGDVAKTGFDVASQNDKKKSVLAAQASLSAYIGKRNSGQPTTPQEDQQAVADQFSLGMTPSIPDPNKQAQEKANLENTQAQTGVYKATIAAKTNPPAKGGTFPAAAVDAWVKKLTTVNPKTGQPYAVISDIPGGMSANSLRAQVAAKVAMDPNYDIGSGAAGRIGSNAGASAGARLNAGGAAQMTARTANAASAQLDILKQVSDKFPRSNVQFMNTPIIAIDSQKMPEAQNWKIAIGSFRNEYASALMRGHMPQGEAQAEVARMLPENITPAQLQSAIPLLRQELGALVKGQMTPATGKEDQGGGMDAVDAILAKHH